MRYRDDSRRGDWGRSDDDWRRERERREAEWHQGSRYARGNDRGWDRSEGYRGAEQDEGSRRYDEGYYDQGSWRREEREPELTGYGRYGEGYGRRDYGPQGYNLGTNYGQGGPMGQGFGQGGSGSSYGREGYGGGYGPGPRDPGYGGFDNPGYRRGEGSWRQGRWESEMQGGNQPYDPFYQPQQGRQGYQYGQTTRPYPQYGRGQGQEGRQPRAPRGYIRSDDRIREDICDAIIMEGIDAGEVEVVVVAGEVTLTGSVDDRQDRRRIEDVADQVPGVKNVNNQLRTGAAQGTSTTRSGVLNQGEQPGQNALGGPRNATTPNNRTI